MKLVIFTLLVVSAFTLFEEGSPVFRLTASNFKSSVLESDEPWLIEFYGMVGVI